MATNLIVNGVSFAYPNTGDQQWGSAATAWAVAVTNGMLQLSGGSFPLTADANFGSSFGLVAQYFKSRSSNLASAGVLRLANTDTIKFRNFANGGDLSLGVNSSDLLTFNGGTFLVSTGLLTNNTVAIINGSGQIASSATTSTQLGFLATAASNVYGATDVATFTNKTFGDASDSTKAFLLSLSGATTAKKTTFVFAQTVDRSITFQDATDTVVMRATTDTLTNKTLTTPILNGVEWAVSATKTANYTLLLTDRLVRGNSGGGTFTFTLPAATTGLEFKIQKVLVDTSFTAITISGTGLSTTLNTAGETLTVFSDGSNWFVGSRYIPQTDTAFTPTFTGWGTATNIDFYWRRLGSSIYIYGYFTTGTTTAVEARVSFPSGLTSAAHGNIKLAGVMARQDATVRNYLSLTQQSVTYLTFSVQDGTRNDLVPANGSDITGASTNMSFFATAPISGWNG